MAGLYAADGSINVSVVDGLSITGLFAADGSINVIQPDGSSYVGLYHPCGAYWVTVAPTDTIVGHYAPDGSLFVCEDPYNPTGAIRVTVVDGSFGVRIILDNNDIDEDASTGDVVGTFSVSDTSGNWADPITYTLLDDAGGTFIIDGDELKVDAALDYETTTSYSIEVEADNGTDDPITRTFTILINDVVEDTTPSAFSFTDVTGASTSTVYESNTITVSGVDGTCTVTVSGTGQYSKNGGSYTSAAGTAFNGDTFKVRLTSSGSSSTAVSTILSIGGDVTPATTDTYTVTTAGAPSSSSWARDWFWW